MHSKEFLTWRAKWIFQLMTDFRIHSRMGMPRSDYDKLVSREKERYYARMHKANQGVLLD